MDQRGAIETKNGAKDFRTDRIAASDIGQNGSGNYATTRQQSPNVRRTTCYISIGYARQWLGMCFALHISMLATNLMEEKKMKKLSCPVCHRQYKTNSILGMTCIGTNPGHEPTSMVVVSEHTIAKKGDCARCGGFGVIIQYRSLNGGTCFACNGTGRR